MNCHRDRSSDGDSVVLSRTESGGKRSASACDQAADAVAGSDEHAVAGAALGRVGCRRV